MNMKRCLTFTVLLFLLSLFSGCAGKRPFLTVQLCLHNKQNVAVFTEMMKSISQSQHMEFTDGGVTTQKDLIKLKVSPNYSLIYMGANRKDGVGWEGGNLGLSAYEVALGFSEGSNPADAHRFSDLVISELKKRWPVYVVPLGHGALPMKSCGVTPLTRK
jgi:hypothetical protein